MCIGILFCSRSLTSLGWRDVRAMLAVWSENTMIARQVDAWLGHKRGELTLLSRKGDPYVYNSLASELSKKLIVELFEYEQPNC